jgi:hypothetical protein
VSVYVLAGTGATVQAFPSQEHPTNDGLFGVAYDPLAHLPSIELPDRRRRRSDEAALAALGVI